jgi:hypothetical protein
MMNVSFNSYTLLLHYFTSQAGLVAKQQQVCGRLGKNRDSTAFALQLALVTQLQVSMYPSRYIAI